MTIQLVYHRDDGGFSAFDERAISIARDADLRIVCPYLTLTYFHRLVDVSKSWQLVTDIEEWFPSLRSVERGAVRDFVVSNSKLIRNVSGIHAKVLIGAGNALIGSANFTTSGIQHRTEMGVFFDDAPHHSELVKWFKSIWKEGVKVPINKLDSYLAALPERASMKKENPLFKRSPQRNMPLVQIPCLDIRSFNGAKGYHMPGNRFCVLKDSPAKGTTSRTFDTFSRGAYKFERDALIAAGKLSRRIDWGSYIFTEDVVFSSPSAAAYLIAGNPRSGTEAWGIAPTFDLRDSVL
jgi:hypothetical protein